MKKFANTVAMVACCTACGFAQGPLFTPAPVVVGEPHSGGVFLVDLNHDGHLDLVTTHILQKRLAAWFGDGKGHFVPAAQVSMDFEAMPGAVALGDVNNDGNLDLGVSSKVGRRERVRIYLGNRGGGFNAVSGPPLAVGESAEGRDYKPVLRFADLDGDGNLDLVSANGMRNSIEIFLGDGHGGFSPGPVVKLEQGPWMFWFALGDLDGDEHLDLATSIPGQPAESAPGRVETRRGDGKGGFAATPDQVLFTAPDPRMATIADVNGDGHPDIVLSHGHTGILSILLNDGQGKFTKDHGSSIKVGWPAWDLAAVDINGDGHVDLVAAAVDPKPPFAARVVVLLGDGHGEFTAAPGSPFPVGAGTYHLAVGDVNGDGKLDIAASSFGSSGVTLLLGR